jgi:hypothetical protein
MSNTLPNVFMFSIALEGYEKTFSPCIESQKRYCSDKKYDYILINDSPRKMKPKEAAWIKIPLIIAALNKGYQWVAFIDSDCEIRNFTPALTTVMADADADKSIFMAKGKSGRLNSGVMFIRNAPSARQFFETILNNADITVPAEDKTAFENGHIIHFGKNNPAIQVLDHDQWNNNSAMNADSYIQHYSSGILRDWFFKEHNMSYPEKPFWEKLKNKIFVPKPHQKGKGYYEGVLSKALDKLMQYYLTRYKSYFSSTAVNN